VLVRAPILTALEVGQTTEHCVLRSELPARQHHLSFTVDEGRQIAEMDESNNHYEWGIPATGAATGADVGDVPSPEPKPSGAQADLTVRAIRINGRAPDGKDDCKDGKNDVTVAVKNVGKGDAGSFAVRLAVDGDDVDAAVDGLDAGQEREVRFDDLPLKRGERTLTAGADVEKTVAESKEDNNELEATARCKDDD
jgi:subtilase family serine protease